ncbi:Uncharacterised protein [Mycobacteroides abscessus subsp. abscessus]|nr:Uncharacterised protein [Mycobacteroides abscessus subsp. abscessus]
MGLSDEQAATELIATLHRLTETMHAAATPSAAADAADAPRDVTA